MKTLRTKPIYKIYFYYNNLTLRKQINILKLKKKKWINLKLQLNQQPKYLCNFRKLNIKRLYYYKFINKQVFKTYLVNYTEASFKSILQQKQSFLIYEQRLDFNLYKAKFVPSLYAARFYITNGYIFVNAKCIRNINYLLHKNDYVTIDTTLKQKINTRFLQNIQHSSFQLYYIPNLEIDYLTYSFIFLDNKKFYISNSRNQIKRINFAEKKKNLKIQQTLQNNYFQYANYFFNYYLFCHDLKKKKKFIQPQQITLILKFLGFYFNDYYFRNLLLKQSFRCKYEYIQNIVSFSQSNTLKNIQILLQTIGQNIYNQTLCPDTTKNLLFLTFFKYHWNLLFSFYTLLLQYKFINFRVLNLNNLIYNYQLLLNKRNFKILFSKIQLFQYFKNYIEKNTICYEFNLISKYKILNYTTIARKYNSEIKYLSVITYKNLLLYISSNQFKYRIYRKCSSFQQNDHRRQKLIFHLKKALTYRYFNKIRLGMYFKQRTRHEFYNFLNTQKKTNLQTNVKHLILIPKLYYPQSSLNYQLIYQPAVLFLGDLIANLRKKKTELQQIQNFVQNSNLSKLQHTIQQKIEFFTNTKRFLNLNYNQYYRTLYLLTYWIQHQVPLHKVNFNNLQLRMYQILYKLHIRQNYAQNLTLQTKRYARSQFNLQRVKLNYWKISYKKSRCLLTATIRKFFVYPSRSFSKYIFNLNLLKFKRSKNLMFDLHQSSLHNNIAIFNFLLISKKFEFCDQIFFIDLFINLTIRKLNLVYNNIKFQNLSNESQKQIDISIVKQKKQSFVKPIKSQLHKINQIFVFNNRKVSNFTTRMNNCQYFKHLKQYKKTKAQQCTVTTIKQKTNRLWILQQLYVSYSIYIRKYRILKYIFTNYIWKEYQVFSNQFFNLEKLKFMNIQYSKLLYFNLLFNKIFNLTTFDLVFQTNYHYSAQVQILINYFILIKRLYY